MPRTLAVFGANSREAIDSLRKARLRTLLGMVGVMVGIASVIAMVSLGEIAREQARKEFEALGTDIMVIRKGFSSSNSIVPLDAALILANEVDLIVESAPRILGQNSFRHAGKQVGNGQVQGVTATFASINQFGIQAGRFISDLDTDQPFCVIGAEIADTIRANGTADPVGEVLEIDDRLFIIAGVLDHQTETYTLPYHVDANRSVFVPIHTANRMMTNAEVEVIVARAGKDVFHGDASAAVSNYFRQRAPELELEIVTAKELIARMESQMGIFSLLLGSVGSISLIVGGIGIMNIMLVSVAERRREIAIRVAIGARRRDILSQFLIESVLLTLSGGILGILLGLTTTWGICSFTSWDFMISGLSVASGLGTATAAGLLFGLQPAYQAARMDPIAGLQSE